MTSTPRLAARVTGLKPSATVEMTERVRNARAAGRRIIGLSSGDPGTLSDDERARRGIADLPRSLGEALDALEADADAMAWLGPTLAKAYLMHKHGEMTMAADKDIDELCRIYAGAY